MPNLTRSQLLTALHTAIEPLPYAQAMWQGGAAAFNRADEWSDIDMLIEVEDGRVAEALAVVEQTVLTLSPIALRYEIPQPAWHGHFQVFYRLAEASEFLMLDLVLIEHSHPNKFLEREIHGEAVVLFDKTGVVNPLPLDRAAWAIKLKERLAALRVTFPLFQPLVTKELHRRNALEALAFYQAMTLRPLVEALRIRHCPARYNFHTRYTQYDLPAAVNQRLAPLFFPRDLEDIRAKHAEAAQWASELLAEPDANAVGAWA